MHCQMCGTKLPPEGTTCPNCGAQTPYNVSTSDDPNDATIPYIDYGPSRETASPGPQPQGTPPQTPFDPGRPSWASRNPASTGYGPGYRPAQPPASPSSQPLPPAGPQYPQPPFAGPQQQPQQYFASPQQQAQQPFAVTITTSRGWPTTTASLRCSTTTAPLRSSTSAIICGWITTACSCWSTTTILCWSTTTALRRTTAAIIFCRTTTVLCWPTTAALCWTATTSCRASSAATPKIPSVGNSTYCWISNTPHHRERVHPLRSSHPTEPTPRPGHCNCSGQCY